jgi:hypothetical protein
MGTLFSASSANDFLAICDAPLLVRTGVLRIDDDEDDDEDDELDEDELVDADRRLSLDEKVSLENFFLSLLLALSCSSSVESLDDDLLSPRRAFD